MSSPTPLTIRNAILSAISGQLGTYTFSDGSTQIAFQATATDSPFPEEPKVTGLEAIYQVDTGYEFRPFLANQYGLRRSGVVTLKQWSITADTRAALDALIPALTRASVRIDGAPIRVPRLARLNNLETASISFSYNSI